MVAHQTISPGAVALSRLAYAPARSTHAHVTRDIAQRVLRGTYPAGSLLPCEAQLMDQYKVSRTALREAIKTLTAKGLLIARAKVGTRVLHESHWNLFDPQLLGWRLELGMDQSFLRRIFEVRQALEPAAAAQAALRRTDDNLVNMRHFLGMMDDPDHTRDTYAEPDLLFHHEVLIASGNPFMQAFSSIIEACINWSFSISAPTDTADRFSRSIGRHACLLDAIAARDPLAASAAMSDIIREAVENARFPLASEPLCVSLPLDL